MGIVEEGGELNRYAAALIKRKASTLVGHHGFTESDREDIEHELWICLLKRQTKFDPERGAETTFIATVIESGVASLIEYRRAAKRGYGCSVCSLDEEIDCGDDLSLLRHEIVDKDTYLRATGRSSRTEIETRDLGLEARRAIDGLPPDLQEIARLLREASISEVARLTGIPRTTLHDKLKAIRRLFKNQGVDEWVK